jgi:hypothetical protein
MSGKEDRTGEEEKADTEEDTNHYLTAGREVSNCFLLKKIVGLASFALFSSGCLKPKLLYEL